MGLLEIVVSQKEIDGCGAVDILSCLELERIQDPGSDRSGLGSNPEAAGSTPNFDIFCACNAPSRIFGGHDWMVAPGSDGQLC